jgi:hypothetical protein
MLVVLHGGASSASAEAEGLLEGLAALGVPSRYSSRLERADELRQHMDRRPFVVHVVLNDVSAAPRRPRYVDATFGGFSLRCVFDAWGFVLGQRNDAGEWVELLQGELDGCSVTECAPAPWFDQWAGPDADRVLTELLNQVETWAGLAATPTPTPLHFAAGARGDA